MKKAFVALFGIVLLTGAFTQADVFKSNEVIDYSRGVVVPCTGEFVLLEGRLHVTQHATFNDNNFNFKSHFNPVNLKGTGDQGSEYNGVGVTRFGDSGSYDGFPWSYTYVNNFYMIGKGQAPNYKVHETMHVTINANGDVTTDRMDTRITCD